VTPALVQPDQPLRLGGPTNASFGRLTNIDSSTVMKPRDYQLGLRLTF
jgi:hypothetical protein